jgi:hypothetical protein
LISGRTLFLNTTHADKGAKKERKRETDCWRWKTKKKKDTKHSDIYAHHHVNEHDTNLS